MQSNLCALFDPATTREEAHAILSRVSSCPDCAGRLQSEHEIRALLKKCCTAEAAPVTLRQRITMEIRVTRFG
ncbi:anti-sigma factor [Corynebacterium testudinoris]|nr:anti-sigma factor [Corynebacterium testudinoris]